MNDTDEVYEAMKEDEEAVVTALSSHEDEVSVPPFFISPLTVILPQNLFEYKEEERKKELEKIIEVTQGESCYIEESNETISALMVMLAIKKRASEIYTMSGEKKIYLYSTIRDENYFDNTSHEAKHLCILLPKAPPLIHNGQKKIDMDALYFTYVHKQSDTMQGIYNACAYIDVECSYDTIIVEAKRDMPLYFYMAIVYFIASYTKTIIYMHDDRATTLLPLSP